MSVRKLKIIRNSIILGTIVVGFILWLQMPAMIQNSKMVHVGTGEQGSKAGALLLLLLPLFALIPLDSKVETHTQNASEQEAAMVARKRKALWGQIGFAILEAVVVIFCMGLGVMAGAN